MLPGRVMLAATTARALRTAPIKTSATMSLLARRTGSQYANMQRCAQFPMLHASFSTKREDDNSLPPLQTVDELIAENEALKKEVAELKEKITKAKPGLMGTIKQYGMPFFLWWTGLYLATGVGLYGAFDMGLLDGAQVIEFVMDIGLDRFIDPTRLDPKHGNLALAIIVNEVIEPIRFPFAVATIPMVKRALAKKEAPASN